MQRHNDEIEKLKIPSAYVALMHQSLRSMMVPVHLLLTLKNLFVILRNETA
ncbi:hypothetical protein JCM19037_1055 [Geomicrobium sp. JCM 19037]|nr:hypothetical protein JCM19037_1055 [Geomicrobium sp. JCM 19037]